MDYIGNIKVGSKVRCVLNNKKSPSKHGMGWSDGKVFVVDRITEVFTGTDKGRYIAWPGGDGHGIFTDCVIPVNLLPEDLFKI